MPVSALPRNITCVDPVAFEAKMIIDASGHDSVAVKRLVDRGLVEWKGMNPMYVNEGRRACSKQDWRSISRIGGCRNVCYGNSRIG